MSKLIKKSFTFEGKRYYVYGKTEVEAEVNKALKLKELEEGRTLVTKDMYVDKWIDICIDTYKTGMNNESLRKYKNRVKNCVRIPLGHMKLKQVKPIHCQECLNRQAGKSKYQIKQTSQMLKFFFGKAVTNKLIPNNPAEDLVIPSGTVSYRRSLTPKEERYFLETASDSKYLIFLLMYYCGCRPSEARALMGKDIQILDGFPVLHIRGTKTDNADRFVPIPDELYSIIAKTKKFSYIATNMVGNAHNEKTFTRCFNSLKREMNIAMGCKTYRNQLIPPFPLDDNITPYYLRHTYCTNLQKKGIDLRTAQYLMGHSDIRMTANIYTHADTSTVVDAAKIIGGVVQGVVHPLKIVEK